MTREYQVYGEHLVRVFGGGFSQEAVDLGLTAESTKIVPRLVHFDKKTDDYGPEIPAEVLFNLADVEVHMDLVHFDREILRVCIANSMAMTGNIATPNDGIVGPAGYPLGAGRPVGQNPNKYLRLTLLPTSADKLPWRFKACYILRNFEWPVGITRTLVHLIWRGILYRDPNTGLISSGTQLWDHEIDGDYPTGGFPNN